MSSAGAAGNAVGSFEGLAGLRERTRWARRASEGPLLIFGVLMAGAAPLSAGAGSAGRPAAGSLSSPLPGLSGMEPGQAPIVGWYWLIALGLGYLLSVLWYRRHAHRSGVWAPTTGFVVSGVVGTAVVVGLPVLSQMVPALEPVWGWPAGLRGTLAFAVVAAGLLVLAGVERSRLLLVIVMVFGAVSLLVSIYHAENLLFRLGWPEEGSGRTLSDVVTVLLPASVLLGGGTITLLTRRGGGRGE
ncbi:hypothetical protein [Actinomadura roseirufa]|uniref:hypothetical protein n=1 Tax=Actinomadura roseirufa TaxID=2094049 RepID=UPI001041B87E|nr:hypothetical protein [Actinomadura roseirufa]